MIDSHIRGHCLTSRTFWAYQRRMTDPRYFIRTRLTDLKSNTPSYPSPSGTAAHFNPAVLRTAKTVWSFGRSAIGLRLLKWSKYIMPLCLFISIVGCIVQSIEPVRQHTSVESLPLIQERQLSVTGESMGT